MNNSTSKIVIGISSCLLGDEVRFDGGHKHSRYITDTLGRYFEFVSFCPEVAIGLGIPRPPIRLVQIGDDIRVRGTRDPDLDVTDALVKYGHSLGKQIGGFSGYILKSRSPSCGMERVKVYGEKGHPVQKSAGAFAQAIMQDFPQLPVEEEGRLMDPVLRENFVERVFIYDRWRKLVQSRLTAGKLMEFHARHKFIILSHDEVACRQLGKMVANTGKKDVNNVAMEYIEILTQALKKRATPRKHTNVLMHIMGFLKNYIDSDDKAELLEVIESYRKGLVPLIVPVTLLRHHLRRYPDEYINSQYYMNPHPAELMLRNHI